MANKNLTNARKAKNDEFYTQYYNTGKNYLSQPIQFYDQRDF